MHIIIKRTIQVIGLSFFVFFLIKQCFFFNQGFLERTASKLAYPLIAISGYIADQINNLNQSKISYEQLEKKYYTLKQDYMDLIDQCIALKIASKEYLETHALKAYIEGQQAKILLRHLDANEHYILINKGTKHGIQKDMIATYQKHLIGRVYETYNWYSKVLLITDQRCSIAAYTSSTQASGIVKGSNHNTRCVFNYVSHLFSISNNDLVISSGQGLIFPEGFCIGKICWHNIKGKSLYHQIEIQPIVNIALINYCHIINGLSLE